MKLIQAQIEKIKGLEGQTFRTSYGTVSNPVKVQLTRWTKDGRDRMYINNVSRGGSLSRDIGQSVGYIDLVTGESHGDDERFRGMKDLRETIIEEILVA